MQEGCANLKKSQVAYLCHKTLLAPRLALAASTLARGFECSHFGDGGGNIEKGFGDAVVSGFFSY
jgi:hypothetical protein